MNFASCQHGNIAMTCPQCRGRAQSVAAPAPAMGFGAVAGRQVAAVPEDDSIEGLYDQSKNADVRFNILVGSQLEDLVARSEQKVEASSDRDARRVKSFWQRINNPTTPEEHEALRAQQGKLAGNS